MYVMEEFLFVERRNIFIFFYLYVIFFKLQSLCDLRIDEYEDILFDFCEEIESEEFGFGRILIEEY